MLLRHLPFRLRVAVAYDTGTTGVHPRMDGWINLSAVTRLRQTPSLMNDGQASAAQGFDIEPESGP